MLLAGDIGGTKTILAIYQKQGDQWLCYKKSVFASADFASFTQLLDQFLSREKSLALQSVCFGVAGPIVEGDCKTTNLPWLLTKHEIIEQTGAEKVLFINDLEATAWGVLGLPEKDFVELNPEAEMERGNKAILAAGTGLGEAMLIWRDKKYHALATEGGHVDFAPRNKLEIGLLQYLMKLYPEHVSYERVLCGQGIVNIYQYLRSIEYAAPDSKVEARMLEEDPAAVIGEVAVAGTDALCVKAVDVFCQLYGAEAGNLALKSLPTGGVILAGGIAAKILACMQKSDFVSNFMAKGRYESVLRAISIKVCLNSEAALLGAVSVAIRMVQ